MSQHTNITDTIAQSTESNVRVVASKAMNLEPLRDLFSTIGPDDIVDGLDEMISLLTTILNPCEEQEFCRDYLQDRLWEVNTLRKAFTKLERSMVHEAKKNSFTIQ